MQKVRAIFPLGLILRGLSIGKMNGSRAISLLNDQRIKRTTSYFVALLKGQHLVPMTRKRGQQLFFALLISLVLGYWLRKRHPLAFARKHRESLILSGLISLGLGYWFRKQRLNGRDPLAFAKRYSASIILIFSRRTILPDEQEERVVAAATLSTFVPRPPARPVQERIVEAATPTVLPDIVVPEQEQAVEPANPHVQDTEQEQVVEPAELPTFVPYLPTSSEQEQVVEPAELPTFASHLSANPEQQRAVESPKQGRDELLSSTDQDTQPQQAVEPAELPTFVPYLPTSPVQERAAEPATLPFSLAVEQNAVEPVALPFSPSDEQKSVEGERQGAAVETEKPPSQEVSVREADPIPAQQQPRAERPTLALAGIRNLLVVLAVLIALGMIAGGVLLNSRAPHSSVILSPTAVASPTLVSTPSSSPVVSPPLAVTYTGTIYNLVTNKKTSLSLTITQQSQGHLSGYLLGAQGREPLSGTSNAAHHVQFTVTDTTGQALFFFDGNQSANTLSGTYNGCLAAQGSQCVRDASNYGLWSVARSVARKK